MDEQERWTSADDVRFRFEAMPESHPVSVTHRFLLLLLDGMDLGELSGFVTPESRGDWGDFSAAIEFAAQIDHPGVSDYVRAAEGAPDVVYTRIVLGIPEAQTFTTPTPMHAHNVNLVWRPEAGGWKIHSLSDDPEPPERLPRSSNPGEIPDVLNL